MSDKKLDELMSAVVTGFNQVETERAAMEERLIRKIDGLQNQLDNEVIKTSSKISAIETRLVDLEEVVN